MFKTKTTITFTIVTIMIMGVSIFVPSLLSQSGNAKVNDCSSGPTLCEIGGSGEKGGGGGHNLSFNHESRDVSFSGGAGHIGGAHLEGNTLTGLDCVGKACQG
jgi:hypothetical protein